MDKQIIIYKGDCLEVMKNIPDNSIDCIICDLPYGTTRNKWDIVIPLDKLWEQYKRIRKDNTPIILFGSEPFSTYLRMSNIQEFKYDWVWNKSQITGFLNAKKQPLRQYELIHVFYEKQCTYNPIMTVGKMQTKATGNGSTNYNGYNAMPTKNNIYYPKNILEIPQKRIKAGHPTQKPIELLEYLVKTYSNEGDLILDNCMGSGTTGIACKKLNRKFIGIELEGKYFEIAEKRIYDR